MVQRERHIADQLQTETADWIPSLPVDAKRLLHAVRAHWSVENTFHRTRDITFREEAARWVLTFFCLPGHLHPTDARLRTGDSAENFAVLRHIALNQPKSHPAKLSLKRKRFKAALDDHFLLDLLAQV
jgi:predicted transposase YbfD/YdcC